MAMDNLTIMTRGFNAGYLLQKYQPELAATIEAGFKDEAQPFAQGFIAGTAEYYIEQGIDKPFDRGLGGEHEYE